jgi:hypothetical protein
MDRQETSEGRNRLGEPKRDPGARRESPIQGGLLRHRGLLAVLLLVLSVPSRSDDEDKITRALGPGGPVTATLPSIVGEVSFEAKAGSTTYEVRIDVAGLPPDTDHAVFFCEGNSGSSPGLCQFIGTLSANGSGHGSLRIEELPAGGYSVRRLTTTTTIQRLKHVAAWFSDPGADDPYVAPPPGPTNPFDIDEASGVMSFRTSTPLP